MKLISEDIIIPLQNIIKETQHPLILIHYNPDGDAIGSALAFYHYLIKKGKKPVLVSPNDYPEFLHWLPGNDKVLVYKRQTGTVLNAIAKADAIFALDFNDADRVNDLEKYFLNAKAKKVLIDHHPEPGNFADLIISDVIYSSTAELVYHVIESLGDENLVDKTIAECLYTGIMTDTGSFNYNSSQPYTYYVVSKL
ncbi:MAG: DHH family phosphoesterase, partial [Bacteroidota bacterium]